MLFFFKYPNFNQLSRKERKKRETPSVDAMECITITHNDTVTYLNYFIIGKVLYFGTTYSTKYKNILLVNNQSGFYHHHQHQSSALLANNAPDLEGRVWKPVLSGWHERWCTLKGRVLWQYKSDHSKQPYKALFLEGCIIEPSCNRKRGLLHPKQLYGVHIEVVDDDDEDDKEDDTHFEMTGKHPSWEFFFEKESEQQIWLNELREAAHTVQFKDSYDVVRLLGQGRAGKVYMMRPKGEDDVVAVKVIEKEELGRIEQRMLRTLICLR